MHIHLFTYGTLMVPEIMAEVAGCRLHSRKAVAHDVVRYGILHEVYPGIVRKTGETTEGILYLDVPPEAVIRLDLFEGEMYARERLRVVRGEGGTESEEAWGYLVKPAYGHLLTGAPWDFARFLTEGRSRFEELYGGYGDIRCTDD